MNKPEALEKAMSLDGMTLSHERVDDLPLLFGVIEGLGLPEVLDRHVKNHAYHQGLSNGSIAAVWLMYLLSEGDHRKCSLQKWADRHQRTLEVLLGQPIRPGIEFNDDRLGGLLHRLSISQKWHAVEADLWQNTVVVYNFPVESVRLDSSTVLGYHTVVEGGVMQFGHSKDHRPDLPQVKLMAACLQPVGFPVGMDVVSGEKADDRLYLPLIERARAVLGITGLLYAGDCKMASLETRAGIVEGLDYYLVPLPMTGETARLMPQWIEAAVAAYPVIEEPTSVGLSCVELLYDWNQPLGEQLLGAGYEFERPMCYVKEIERQTSDGFGGTMTVVDHIQKVEWIERVQVIRSKPLADLQSKGLEHRLSKAQETLFALTPQPAKGRKQIREEADLQTAIAQVLERYEVAGLLEVNCERQEKVATSYIGRGRGSQSRPTRTTTEVRYQINQVERKEADIQNAHHRLGWRAQVTNQLVSKMSLEQTVWHYRQGSCLEQDFHMLKDRPLGISPMYVRRDDQITGLTHLLMLALRLLLLIQIQVRHCLEQTQESLPGLYEGQPRRTTSRPTAVRLLKAVAAQEITLTKIELGASTLYHLSSSSELIHQLLRFLKLPPDLYTRLAQSPSPTNAGKAASSSLFPPDPSLIYLQDAQNSS